MTDPWKRALRSAFAPARELEPTEDEVQRVLAMDAARARRRPPLLRLVAVACSTLVVAGGAYAAPPTRTALDDVYGTVTGWVSSDDEQASPGRPLGPDDDAPAWVQDAGGDKRLVAQDGGASLYAVRGDDDTISFALGGSVGLSDSVEGWRRQLEGRKIVLLGPGAFPDGPINDRDQRPVFGVTSRSVARVELRYTTGQSTTQDGLDGGFVLLADAHRQPTLLIALDQAGRELGRIDVSDLALGVCRDTRGCPPGQPVPSADKG